ncbi:hypothetical protein [Pseudohalioglobus lutimaris]|uniref:TolC family protein n=1 Tax=Pseudohalioglobus lutimaris TaxID=1737061 RepID=A0A2N5WY82_9GAMM|nr:hypothetical protein [Pseudohalioglobus lutimaris]PLW67204.1 hypothetical protein C0039_18190 [Pseudohalioglobus lutimaris]
MKPHTQSWPAAIWTAALALTLSVTGVAAEQGKYATDVSLSDLLEATAGRQPGKQRNASDAAPFRTSTWLAALPSVAVSYLRSDETQGTDETELSLNLPMKSPYLAEQDKALRQLGEALAGAETRRRSLYFSGMLRETLWSERIASTRVRYTADKIEELDRLYRRQQALFEARASNRYSLLLLRQELADARLLLAEQELELRRWRQRYRELTGMGNLPRDIAEPESPTGEAWQTHPALEMLTLGWQRQRLLIAATSTRAGNWNLALQAKQLDNPAFEENQYGVAIEIPLSVLATAGESSNSEWRESNRRYWQERDELQLQLARNWQELVAESRYLQQRQTLLQEAASASHELLGETRLLAAENELAREVWVRRVLGDLDKQAESAINQLLIGQNRAMRRQAAGIPL